MLEELFQVLLQVLPTIVMIVIGYGAKALAEEFKANQYIVDCINAVEDAVNLVAQTYTGELKDKNGCLSPIEQRIALEKAKEAFLESMGDSAKTIIEAIYGDFDKWLETRVDIVLGKDKK